MTTTITSTAPTPAPTPAGRAADVADPEPAVGTTRTTPTEPDPGTGARTDATPRAPRTAGAPRQRGPAGYPRAATRPRVRKVLVGAPSARRPAVLDDEPEPRPLREEAPAPLPDPTAQCCAVVRAAVEVLRGERPAGQLARWVTPQVRDQLVERARLLREHVAAGTVAERAANRPVQVRRVRLVRLGDDVAEATVVLDDDGRVRAAAVRLEARRGTWRVAVLEIG